MNRTEKPVGRIEYLGTDGRVAERIEFFDVKEMLNALAEEEYCGAPVRAVIYRYGGESPEIPAGFILGMETTIPPVYEDRE